MPPQVTWPPLKSLVGHVIEVTVGVRIVQGAVLAEALDVIAALDLMQHGEAAPVGAGDDVGRGASKSRPQVLPPPSANSSNSLGQRDDSARCPAETRCRGSWPSPCCPGRRRASRPVPIAASWRRRGRPPCRSRVSSTSGRRRVRRRRPGRDKRADRASATRRRRRSRGTAGRQVQSGRRSPWPCGNGRSRRGLRGW